MALETVTFNYTGATQTWRVPGHVPATLKFRLVGGKGGDHETGYGEGGEGGYIAGVLDIVRGTTLTIGLGGAGETSVDEPNGVITVAQGGGGPRPGGDGGISGSHAFAPPDASLEYDSGGGGGGGSELKIGSTVIAVAGGGGGAGYGQTVTSDGSDGAAQTGSGAGTLGTADAVIGGDGQGGSTSAAGAGGYSATDKYPTYLEVGGDASGSTGGEGASFIYVPGSPAFESRCGGGGGGGGGYYGGGGGGGSKTTNPAGGGGGGSSWSSGTYVTEGTGPAAITEADGYLIFEWEPAGGMYTDGSIHLS